MPTPALNSAHVSAHAVSAAVPCLAIAGPTASGKTAAALALAQRLADQGRSCEIISVDSALVYRGMDIGTAKPSAAERAAVRHHLIDILDPVQTYSAAEFVLAATRLVGEIRARGAVPLLVGGTMLYFKALRDGLDDMPPADADLRAQLDSEAAAQGWAALHAQLAQVDPHTAARLAPHDSQRIQRALEVWRISGRPLSSFHTRRHSSAMPALIHPQGFFSLEPHERAWLHARIAQRFEAMLEQGFLEEMQRLRARADLHLNLPSMRCVGYRQAWELEDDPLQRGQLSLLRERAVAATRQLAKRQITWLRSMPERRAMACDAPHAQSELVQAALDLLL